jgi:hypothetical protein
MNSSITSSGSGQVYLWEYTVKAGSVEQFERTYGPEGEWAQLFQKSAAYRGTLLLRDPVQPLRFVTIDFWNSDLEYQRFKKEQSKQYAELDRKCDALTVEETFLGGYKRSPDQTPIQDADSQ